MEQIRIAVFHGETKEDTVMNTNEISKMVNDCAEELYKGNEYGAADYNSGVYALKSRIARSLACEYAKGVGLNQIAHIDPVELERSLSGRYDGIHFTCRICNDYSRRKLNNDDNDTASFYCHKCGALWIINKKWNIAFNEQWSKAESSSE